MTDRSEAAPEALQAALSSVARAIAESLELKDVWGRVAEACRTVVPFDAMGVSRFEAGPRVRTYVTAGEAGAFSLEERLFARDDFSARLWPPDAAWPRHGLIVDDAPRELDASRRVDGNLLQAGARSILRLGLGRDEQPAGSLVLMSRQPGYFTADHVAALEVVGDLMAIALAHEAQAGQWRDQAKRRDALARLTVALAGTLDVRSIFQEMSRIAQEMIPHDYFILGMLTEDRQAVRIHAKFGTSGDASEDVLFALPPEEQRFTHWDYYLARDHTVLEDGRLQVNFVPHRDPARPLTVVRALDEQWRRIYTEFGVRSALRVPVRLNGVTAGGIEFSSRRPDMFDEEHAEFGVRLAEHVSLALAHQHMAEEARRAAAAQEKATRLGVRVQSLVRELETLTPHRALGRSRAWRDVLAQANKVAPVDTTVLITGESGTGKEVMARYIHRRSARADGPFVALNCAALPEQLLESELFGHEKGAFTGAIATRLGRVEQAERGVLFLDEVGEMSPAVQAKFLRVLQEREYQRLGGLRTLAANIRVLAATNRDLPAAVARGAFREDLYYRLAVFDIALPPLRERAEDVLVLAEAFLEEIGRSVGRPAAGFSDEVRGKLTAYPWPGNVRELRNAVERAVILCEGGLITSDHLPPGLSGTGAPAPRSAAAPAASTLESAQREMIVDALARAGHNKSKAARLLGLTRAQLRSRIEKHGIPDEDD
jgi:transcriptional regulator with GAF, ATPase, and Fis domain